VAVSGNQEDTCEESGGDAGDVECIAIPSHCNSGVGKALASPALLHIMGPKLKPNLDPVSCEAFFGNGFTQTFRVLESERRLSMNLTRKSELLDRSSFRFNLKEALGAWTLSKSKQSQGDEGRLTGVADVHTTNTTLEATHIQSLRESLFRCFYSETLRTCICEGKNMVMNPKKTKMAKGGEPLESVMRRNEEEELPRFTSGAFQIIVPEGERKPLFNKTLLQHLMPQGLIQEHLFEQIHTIPVNKVTCAQVSFFLTCYLIHL
jgi:glycoprotein 2-beta-D-xylosyltransferase